MTLRAFGLLSRTTGALVAVAMSMCLLASVAFAWSVPLKVRAGGQESDLTLQAQQLVGQRDRFGVPDVAGRIDPGVLSASGEVTRVGDFDVSRVGLDDYDLAGCVSPPGNGGLRYRLGPPDSSTDLIYCPLHAVEGSSIHSGVYHLGGPWYLEYIEE